MYVLTVLGGWFQIRIGETEVRYQEKFFHSEGGEELFLFLWLPRETVDSLSLQALKAGLDGILGSLMQWLAMLRTVRGLEIDGLQGLFQC